MWCCTYFNKSLYTFHIFQKKTWVRVLYAETVLKVNRGVMPLHSAAVLKYLNLGTYAKTLSRLCIIYFFVCSQFSKCV